ncbi:uncharacterized protein LOC119708027 isoform X2 [Motacilla alba alba]|uniref:uncharacterized protein LOC119708027 isoform X1 n=1 Tax=Motacilla alba alba TaxID=1094192 RepID=UPI0018D4E47A|nr:uncharacterized protein LOC119708027 isoform X1 [Motacilla alba alba]XP_038009736.1 uncharacterized protein LOC119708027 isoform X2 [Motacilla alba alba]
MAALWQFSGVPCVHPHRGAASPPLSARTLPAAPSPSSSLNPLLANITSALPSSTRGQSNSKFLFLCMWTFGKRYANHEIPGMTPVTGEATKPSYYFKLLAKLWESSTGADPAHNQHLVLPEPAPNLFKSPWSCARGGTAWTPAKALSRGSWHCPGSPGNGHGPRAPGAFGQRSRDARAGLAGVSVQGQELDLGSLWALPAQEIPWLCDAGIPLYHCWAQGRKVLGPLCHQKTQGRPQRKHSLHRAWKSTTGKHWDISVPKRRGSTDKPTPPPRSGSHCGGQQRWDSLQLSANPARKLCSGPGDPTLEHSWAPQPPAPQGSSANGGLELPKNAVSPQSTFLLETNPRAAALTQRCLVVIIFDSFQFVKSEIHPVPPTAHAELLEHQAEQEMLHSSCIPQQTFPRREALQEPFLHHLPDRHLLLHHQSVPTASQGLVPHPCISTLIQSKYRKHQEYQCTHREQALVSDQLVPSQPSSPSAEQMSPRPAQAMMCSHRQPKI